MRPQQLATRRTSPDDSTPPPFGMTEDPTHTTSRQESSPSKSISLLLVDPYRDPALTKDLEATVAAQSLVRIYIQKTLQEGLNSIQRPKTEDETIAGVIINLNGTRDVDPLVKRIVCEARKKSISTIILIDTSADASTIAGVLPEGTQILTSPPLPVRRIQDLVARAVAKTTGAN